MTAVLAVKGVPQMHHDSTNKVTSEMLWKQPVPGRMMLRIQAMIARGSGIDGIARCRGPRFSCDTTTVVWWRVSVTGGSRICTLCDLLERTDLLAWSSSLVTSSVSSDDVTAAAAESLVSACSWTDVGRASSTDISLDRAVWLHTFNSTPCSLYTATLFYKWVDRHAKQQARLPWNMILLIHTDTASRTANHLWWRRWAFHRQLTNTQHNNCLRRLYVER